MLSYRAIAEAVRGRLLFWAGGAPSRVVHDSRAVRDGDLFIALKGERTDGHLFLEEAFARGAAGALVSDFPSVPPRGRNLIVVENTRKALWDLAAAWRRELSATFVGVTGSCGKTTTKELVGHLLAEDREVFVAPESYNTEVGLPLALLSMSPRAQVGVFELGASAPGEIGPLASLLLPTVAVLTMVGRAHLAGFGDLAAVAAEKWELVRSLPLDGLAIANADSPELASLAAAWPGRLSTFGLTAGTLRGRIVSESPSLVVETERPPLRLFFPLLGRHNATNLLAAVSCALELGILPPTIERRAATFAGAPHRLALVPAPFGYVLDDTYNANPDSMAAALRTLAELDLPVARRAFVFGDMLELGEEAERLHREVLDLALHLGIAPIFPVGELAEKVCLSAEKASPPRRIVLTEGEPLADCVRKTLQGERTLLLVKGSRRIGLDRLVGELTSLSQPDSRRTSG